MKKLRTVTGLSALALGATLFTPILAHFARAATLHGSVKLPDGARSRDSSRATGDWKTASSPCRTPAAQRPRRWSCSKT